MKLVFAISNIVESIVFITAIVMYIIYWFNELSGSRWAITKEIMGQYGGPELLLLIGTESYLLFGSFALLAQGGVYSIRTHSLPGLIS
jgi:hypothetical protein